MLELRREDDFIVHTLNDLSRGNTEPSVADCERVWARLQEVYLLRAQAIDSCMAETTAAQERLRSAPDRDEPKSRAEARALTRRVDSLDAEQDVESITKARTAEAFHARCRALRAHGGTSPVHGATKPAPTTYRP